MVWKRGDSSAAGEPPRVDDGAQPLPLSPWLNYLSFVGSIVLTAFILVFLRPILMPLVVAVFISYLVRPMINFISERRWLACLRRLQCCRSALDSSAEREQLLPPNRDGADEEAGQPLSRLERCADSTVPRWFGVVLALVASLAIIMSLLTAVVYSITALEGRIPAYQARAQELWETFLEWCTQQLQVDLEGAYEDLPSRIYEAVAMPVLTTAVQVVTNTMLILVFLIFVLLVPPSPRTSLRGRIDELMTEYIVLKSCLACSVALIVFIFFSIVDMPLRFCLALATVVLFTIPNLGPLVATLLPVPIVLLESFSLGRAAVVILVPGALHLIVGNLIEPFLFSGKFSLTPVLILSSLGVWMLLWGTAGALLAVPLTCVIRIIFDYLSENFTDVPYVAAASAAFRGALVGEAWPPQAKDRKDS